MTLKSKLSANSLRFPLGQTDDGLRSGSASLGADGPADTPSWCLRYLLIPHWAVGSFQFQIVSRPILSISALLSCRSSDSDQGDNVLPFTHLASLRTSFRLHLFLPSSSLNHLVDCEGISLLLVLNGAWSKKHSGLAGLLSEKRL